MCVYLAGKGVEKYSPGNHGGQIDFGAFSVAFVPAWHSSSTIVDGVPIYLGNPAGVVITAKGEKTLLHMGDTDIFPGMELINEFFAPKIGIVPIGDRFTMGATRAALACKRYFDFETVIPSHYATFGLLDADADKFIAAMGNEQAKVLVSERGVAVAL